MGQPQKKRISPRKCSLCCCDLRRTALGSIVRSGSLSELKIKIRVMALSDLPAALRRNYEVHEWRHASAVLRTDFPNEWSDIIAVLSGFRLKKSQISVGGGAKSSVADSIDQGFFACGWQEKKFATQIRVDQNVIDSPTHKVDCFKNGVGVEIEWNNKTEFYDRDL